MAMRRGGLVFVCGGDGGDSGGSTSAAGPDVTGDMACATSR